MVVTGVPALRLSRVAADQGVELLAPAIEPGGLAHQAIELEPGLVGDSQDQGAVALGRGQRHVVGHDHGAALGIVLKLADAVELGQGGVDVAEGGQVDGVAQLGIALAPDLLHAGGAHAGGLQLVERPPGLDRLGLGGVAEQDHADAGLLRGAQEPLHEPRGDDTGLVQHQDSAVVDALVLGIEEGGQGVGLEALAAQLPDLAAIGGDRADLVALLRGDLQGGLQRRRGGLQHGGLARAGQALDADDSIRTGEDGLDGVGLAAGEPGRRDARARSPPA